MEEEEVPLLLAAELHEVQELLPIVPNGQGMMPFRSPLLCLAHTVAYVLIYVILC